MRRYGRTKQMFEEMEKAYAENPNMIIWGPSCPMPSKNIYDGDRLQHYDNLMGYDDPWYIPIELLLKDPELYHKLVADKKSILDNLWGGIARPILNSDKIIGKAIFISTMEDERKPMWGNESTASGSLLKRYFIPSTNGLTDEYGNPKEPEL